MALDHTSGQMDECSQGSMTMTKSMDMESTLGLMTGSIKDGGRKESKMV